MLRTKSAAVGQAAIFAFFPLIFLSTTFVPKEFIQVDCVKWVATINSTTYVFEAMGAALIDGWEARPLLVGLAVVIGFVGVTGFMALYQARKSTHLTG